MRTYCQNKIALSLLYVAYSEPIRTVLHSYMIYQFLKRGADKCELQKVNVVITVSVY